MSIAATFYETDKAVIVAEAKRLLGIDVCPTCHGQLVKAYQNLKTYHMNNTNTNTNRKYTPKPEHVGGTFTNGVISLSISDATDADIEKHLTASQIDLLFITSTNEKTVSNIQPNSGSKGKQSNRKSSK
jgi:hypothetical protein